MPLAAIPAVIGAAAIGGGTAVAGGLIGSSAAKKAANSQAQAAMYAADLQDKEANNALAFQNKVYSDQQANLAPWIAAGKNSLAYLSSTYGNGGPTWDKTFTAPTAVTEQNDPGYQFRLQQGQQALERSAAARGNLLTGGTAKAEQRYGQDYASNEYSNVYNRSLNDYMTNYNTWQQNVANQYNRAAGIAGIGQTATAQLGQAGQNAANTTANINLTAGQQIGNDYQAAGAARASGYAGSANAWNGALGNIGNLALYYGLNGGFGGGGGGSMPYGNFPVFGDAVYPNQVQS